jgi:hypothetical protein
MKISILHPSRGRPNLALDTFRHWLYHAVNSENIQYILSVDSSDPHLPTYKSWADPLMVINNNTSAIEAINNAAKVSTGDLLIVVSDDFFCPQN